ncbi:MAG: diaminopimelate epimerase [Verrucomicrobia bacterium]|nr:diaminopimelate epimerase [Verrucomicrobiota bacterium]
MLRFTKMNGAGNDFVLIDNRSGALKLTRDQIAFLCDRHRGIGADGVLLAEPATGAADFRMRYYNNDGGEAEMCGNGARCFSRFLNSIAGPLSQISFETRAGIIRAEIEGEHVKLGMGRPRDLLLNRTLDVGGVKLSTHFVNTGVPHVVTFVDDTESTPVEVWGAEIRFHAAFRPNGTNANFVEELEPGKLAIRTYERGVEAETLACGTGVIAAALIYSALSNAPAPLRLRVRGGDWLEVGFRVNGQEFEDVTLKGPADFTFEGCISNI